MADKPENQTADSGHAEANRQHSDTAPNGHALAEDPSGKGRIHRSKLSLRYNPRTFATDL